MSVIVKGMKMPENCAVCDMMYGCEFSIAMKKRPFDCPLIEVPEHGRLIDADYLIKKLEGNMTLVSFVFGGKLDEIYGAICNDMIKELTEAPTVIHADKDGEP